MEQMESTHQAAFPILYNRVHLGGGYLSIYLLIVPTVDSFPLILASSHSHSFRVRNMSHRSIGVMLALYSLTHACSLKS